MSLDSGVKILVRSRAVKSTTVGKLKSLNGSNSQKLDLIEIRIKNEIICILEHVPRVWSLTGRFYHKSKQCSVINLRF